MKWSDVRLAYPDQWLVVEALAAHTTADSYRVPDNLAVLEACVMARLRCSATVFSIKHTLSASSTTYIQVGRPLCCANGSG